MIRFLLWISCLLLLYVTACRPTQNPDQGTSSRKGDSVIVVIDEGRTTKDSIQDMEVDSEKNPFQWLANTKDTFRLQTLDTARVQLHASFTTGYLWRMKDSDTTVVHLARQYQTSGTRDGKHVDIQNFDLVAVMPGEFKVTFNYGRPFGEQKEPALSTTIVLIVLKN